MLSSDVSIGAVLYLDPKIDGVPRGGDGGGIVPNGSRRMKPSNTYKPRVEVAHRQRSLKKISDKGDRQRGSLLLQAILRQAMGIIRRQLLGELYEEINIVPSSGPPAKGPKSAGGRGPHHAPLQIGFRGYYIGL